MSVAPEDAAYIDQSIEAARRLIAKLERSLAAAAGLNIGDGAALAALSEDDTDRIDLFLKHFENAFEMGRRLFRAGLVIEEEPQAGLSYVDLLNRAEKIGVLSSAVRWRAIGRVRNAVVHDYAMAMDDAAEAIRGALSEADVTLRILTETLSEVSQRRTGLDEAG